MCVCGGVCLWCVCVYDVMCVWCVCGGVCVWCVCVVCVCVVCVWCVCVCLWCVYVCVYVCVCVPHVFSVRSSVGGHSGCLHVLPVVNSAAMNIGVPVPLN